MPLIRKHFQITKEQLDLIQEESKEKSTPSHPWSESDVVREALDEHFKKNGREK